MSNSAAAPKIGKRGADAYVAPSGGFDRTHWFSLDDKETGIYRFLTDWEPVTGPDGEPAGGWPAFNQHQSIPTKPKPSDQKGNWPKSMPANCRRDPQFADSYSECYICDVLSHQMQNYKKPGQRYWALAVVREAVVEGGKVVGYRDKTIEVTRKDDNGNETTTTEKLVVMVNQAWKNFFSILNGYGSAYGTVLDRDYQITRNGEMLETNYTIIPLKEITTTLDGVEVPFDLRNDALMARYLPDAAKVGYAKASDDRLIPVIAERASDDFYGRFFDASVVSSSGTPDTASGAVPASVASPDEASDAQSVQSLVDRIRGVDPKPHADAAAAPAASGGRDFS